MITLDTNDTNMELKEIFSKINRIPNLVINVNPKVIKEGVGSISTILANFSKEPTTL